MKSLSIPATARLVGVIGIAGLLAQTSAYAADHGDAPAATDDPAADLGDFYAWHTDGGTIVLVSSFAGRAEAGMPAVYDADALYGFHVDRDGDHISDHDIWVRFGQNTAGDWGVQVVGLPDSTEAVTGPVEMTLSGAASETVYAGLREDPFFFDADGFAATLDSGTLMFDPTNDSFAATNTTAIVLEVDAASLSGGSDNLSMWTSSHRKQ